MTVPLCHWVILEDHSRAIIFLIIFRHTGGVVYIVFYENTGIIIDPWITGVQSDSCLRMSDE